MTAVLPGFIPSFSFLRDRRQLVITDSVLGRTSNSVRNIINVVYDIRFGTSILIYFNFLKNFTPFLTLGDMNMMSLCCR